MLLLLLQISIPTSNQATTLIPFSPKVDEDINYEVNKYAEELQRTFGIFLKSNDQPPPWKLPSDLDEGTQSHINNLRIPTISPGSKFPLLLLHELGQSSHDPQLAKHVDGLFDAKSR